MSKPQKRKHTLAENWQDAYVEEKIRALVRALNRRSLGIRTIAACEGHQRYPNSPYVFFRGPIDTIGQIAKRILLAQVRFEGLNYDWYLEGSFNKEFVLGFSLRSRTLQQAHENGVMSRLWVYQIRRQKIDDDLALLGEIIDDLLEGVEATGKPEIPDPYDKKNHRDKPAKPFVASFLGGMFSKWINMRAIWAFLDDRGRGKWMFTNRTRNQFSVHSKSPKTGANRYGSLNNISLLVVCILLAAGFGMAAFAQGAGSTGIRVAAVKSVYDGDTFRADIEGIGKYLPIRVAGVDTPEIKGRCPDEIKRALKARDFTAALLKAATTIQLQNLRLGYYGRIVAEVRIDGQDLAAILIEQGLGRPYSSGRRGGWCRG